MDGANSAAPTGSVDNDSNIEMQRIGTNPPWSTHCSDSLLASPKFPSEVCISSDPEAINTTDVKREKSGSDGHMPAPTTVDTHLVSASPHRNGQCRHCHYLHRPPPLVGNREQSPLLLEDVAGSTRFSF